uniref:ATP synthase complex subunit 8 n=1 Tax=Oreophryne sp. TNHC-GDC 18615 TaxID=1933078 RepID=A0A343VTE7_9NEOB|nr:ATP synthase subunit 8 [Oreophryne sp. TNHC-GDC 18615]
MPQLIPTPWFLTLLFFWLALTVFSPKKTLHITPNDPLTNTTKMQHQDWNWPWL